MSRVLVVDDEPQIRRTLAINLRAVGYQVDLAATGEEALKAAADQPPDVVILDLGLPGISGLQVIQGLRGWTRTPIIVLSVREREADAPASPSRTPRSSRPPTSASTWPPSRSPGTAGRSASPPPSGSWSRSWSAIPAGWSASGSCCRRSGGPSTRRRPTTCACSSPRSAASWNPIPRTPATSSPKLAWAIGSNPRTNPGAPTNQDHLTAPKLSCLAAASCDLLCLLLHGRHLPRRRRHGRVAANRAASISTSITGIALGARQAAGLAGDGAWSIAELPLLASVRLADWVPVDGSLSWTPRPANRR
jgi:CheY-like chemotaxis protein